ncbi:MAG: hypothetical protein WA975_23215 [Mesorhizobium sp.]
MSITPHPGTDENRRAGGEMEVVSRLAAVIRDARLECECRSKLDETLERFAALERRRTARGHLSDARHRRETIEAILFFLKDLDELETTEQDRSVYVDIALLFDDIADNAREGAMSMRQLSSSLESEDRRA